MLTVVNRLALSNALKTEESKSELSGSPSRVDSTKSADMKPS